MIYALVAALAIAALALVGALFVGNHPHTERLHRLVLPAAVGVFLGIVFFELIPETLEASETGGAIAILIGFLGFYLLSHFLETYHHHHHDNHDECSGGSGARKLLIGDAVHNLADGVVIATSFLINPMVGLLTSIGIALHEIPQEIAEYAVLRAAGYSQKRALILNLLSASTVVVGVLLTYVFGIGLGDHMYILTGIAAGNLLYIATADLIPELRHSHRDHFAKIFIATILGVVLIGSIVTLTH
jgi:zinc and cadmium transporter